MLLQFLNCINVTSTQGLISYRIQGEFLFFCYFFLNKTRFGISIAKKPFHVINILTTYFTLGAFSNHQILGCFKRHGGLLKP